MEIVRDFIFLVSKITADGDCSHEIKQCLLLGRKAMTNLDTILKLSTDVTLLTKVCLVKAMVFPVVIYGYESWTIKKAEHQRIDAFGLWCWRRFLRVPQTANRSTQSILHVYYHVRNKSPVYVQCRIQDAWGWCMGMIQRDDMEWEGGSGLGTHVHPWWIHVNVWQNQYSIEK